MELETPYAYIYIHQGPIVLAGLFSLWYGSKFPNIPLVLTEKLDAIRSGDQLKTHVLHWDQKNTIDILGNKMVLREYIGDQKS